ncbi:retrovirus-related Pol polyprotein from transposon 297 [Trichonephila clavipes]|nr:retrovirus-related Pol polyprotein from transposon 297 [Trichonephila clavipes]
MLKPYYKRPEHVNVIINDETKNSLADQELEIPYLENNSLVYDFEDVIEASEVNKHLHDKQMDRLRELLSKYSKCFSNNPGLTNLVEHEIQLVSDQPVRTKPYRMSHRENEILKNEINRMLKLRIIEVGESDYMPLMILVEVAGKEPRPCIDYRKLNGIIRTEYFPLPNIEERVEKVSVAKFITVFDLSKGYWQIPLSKTAQRYAAFCTSFGTYRPLRMSFGLKNAPYFFSKLMAELLNGLEDFVVPYLDDIAIFSDTWESHIKHKETVLQRIKRAKLTIKPSKCKFAQQNVKFLGHIVGQGFRTPSEIKVQAVLEFPTPRTKTQIRAFLGIAGYYQKYINLFSVIAAPLTDALKGEIKWTTECENAFRELKGKLIDKLVLYAPNFEREFIVQTDASNAGMGAVLTQLTEQGEEHPILYLSKKFSEVEKRYCTTEKECASIVFAIKRLHYYLDGNSFLVMTDHNPLVWLNRNVSSNPRLMRWALALQPYNFRTVHRSGNSHKNADSLSRSEELNDYEKLKSIVLREFQVTPRECLNSFKNAVKSSGETYIQFAARLTANFQYYCSLRKVNSFESLCDLLISDKLFETLNKETATHIGIREAEDWFRPIDLAKECDIYISSRSGSRKETPIACGYTEDSFKNRPRNYKPKIKDSYPQNLERQNKNCYICGDSSHYARDCEKRFKPKESNGHIHNRKNANSLKVKSEKQKSDEFAQQLQYVNIFIENQPVTALIDSGCQIPVLNSSLIRVNKPSEGRITLSSCFNEKRLVEVAPINISLTQHSPSLSVRTAISPTLTEEFIIHPSVYTEIKKISHAKRAIFIV